MLTRVVLDKVTIPRKLSPEAQQTRMVEADPEFGNAKMALKKEEAPEPQVPQPNHDAQVLKQEPDGGTVSSETLRTRGKIIVYVILTCL